MANESVVAAELKRASGKTIGDLAAAAWPELSPVSARRKLERLCAGAWLKKVRQLAEAAGLTPGQVVDLLVDKT